MGARFTLGALFRPVSPTQCRITNVGGLVQNFSGGLFSRRMGAPFPEEPVAFYFVSLRSSVQKD